MGKSDFGFKKIKYRKVNEKTYFLDSYTAFSKLQKAAASVAKLQGGQKKSEEQTTPSASSLSSSSSLLSSSSSYVSVYNAAKRKLGKIIKAEQTGKLYVTHELTKERLESLK